MPDAIHIRDLRLAFGDRTLVDGFDWCVAAGSRSTLTGPSGCGKSTLLKCLLGFEQPAAGSIDILDMPVSPSSVWSLRQQVAWVPQEPELGDGKAHDFLRRAFSYRANRALSDPFPRAAELAKEFLLADGVLDQPIHRLSGGEKQRIALISALVLERPLLLLDEPYSALDAEARRRVAEAIARTSATVITASHEPLVLEGDEQVVALAPAGGAHQ